MDLHTLARLGAVVAAALVLGSCQTSGSRLVLPVAFEEPAPAATLRYPDDFRSHEATVRGVASLLSRELALPVPDRVMVYIYSTRAVFEQGLMNDGRLPAVRAAELSEFAVGVGKRRQLLLQDEGSSQPAARDWGSTRWPSGERPRAATCASRRRCARRASIWNPSAPRAASRCATCARARCPPT